MAERKPLEQLTLMDDYMFWVVMKRKDLLMKLLECILNIKLVDLVYAKGQETLKEGYDSRGVRLDVFVKDEQGRWDNIEVQTTDKKDIPKRSRYNQAVVDVEELKPGEDFNKLQECFIIFITKFDTYRRDKKLYWFEKKDRFEKDLLFGDGGNDIIVNIMGTKGEVSKELDEVIGYLKSGEATDPYTKELDEEVRTVKESDERKSEYMRFKRYEDELRRDERLQNTASHVKRMMDKLGYTLADAMDFDEVDEYDRPEIEKLVDEMIQAVPA
ncbi:MAG: Rpn family recombination-promoting nuclease/putative transposase [Blautia sp.]|nr:Rpn family recombination-promoting nuclease/putative transposase [Blautia sp.]